VGDDLADLVARDAVGERALEVIRELVASMSFGATCRTS